MVEERPSSVEVVAVVRLSSAKAVAVVRLSLAEEVAAAHLYSAEAEAEARQTLGVAEEPAHFLVVVPGQVSMMREAPLVRSSLVSLAAVMVAVKVQRVCLAEAEAAPGL